MHKLQTNTLKLYILVLLSGCWSSPIRNITPGPKTEPKLPIGSYYVVPCKSDANRDLTPEKQNLKYACEHFHKELESSINVTAVLERLDEPTYEIELLQLPDRSPYGGLSHFPPAYLLSVAIPFWETKEYGFYFSITDLKTGQKQFVDSREKGTFIMWLPAVLLNLFPDRIWERKSEVEIKDLRNRILNALEGKR